MEQAIKDAVEKGGWMYLGEHRAYVPEYIKAPGVAQFALHGVDFLITKEQALLDPAFWQALGKEREWGTEPIGNTVNGFPVQEYLMFWHRLIDHLASGNDVESFFGALAE